MRYLSVCSGIEASTAAWKPLGWEAVAFSEIERFPCSLLAHHYPDVPNWGDLTKFKDWPNDREIDLLIGGTPCQSFSVSGNRKGLDDLRGQLMFSYVGVAEKYRPEWLIWENVPGVLSSGGGRDFAAFLGALAKLGYWWSWRVLDAQHIRVDGFEGAVPQKRRRVYFVGHLGDWRAAAEVLFEPESLSGSAPPKRREKAPVAATLTRSIAECGWSGNIEAAAAGFAIPVAGTLKSRFGRDGGAGGIEHACAGYAQVFRRTAHSEYVESDISATIKTGSRGGGTRATSKLKKKDGEWLVRRVMPIECERLMGFPDGYTNIPGASDTARYRALGNSMAVNCVRWVGRRIERQIEIERLCR